MRNPLFILLFYLCSTSLSVLSAQREAAALAVQRFNAKMATYKKGHYETSSLFVSMMEGDTSRSTSKVYFFRESGTRDTIAAQFVVVTQKGVTFAYDGDSLYTVYHNGKKINIQGRTTFKGRSVTNKVHEYAFLPLLRTLKRQAHMSKLYKEIMVERPANSRDLLLTIKDSIDNPLAAKKGTLVTTYHLDSIDYSVRRYEEWAYLMKTPQYMSIKMSPIQDLPAAATFATVFNLDSLYKQGYTLSESVKSTPSKTIKVGEVIPDFTLKTMQDDYISLSDIQSTYLLLDFWYRSCAPCLMSMPHVETLFQRYKKDNQVHVLGVNVSDKNDERFRDFLQDRQISYPVVFDEQKKLANSLSIEGYPALILVDTKTKKVVYVQKGFSTDMTEQIEKHIKK